VTVNYTVSIKLGRGEVDINTLSFSFVFVRYQRYQQHQQEKRNTRTMPSPMPTDNIYITLRDGRKIIARPTDRNIDRETVYNFRVECGWDMDKVDDWFNMVEEGLRLEYMAIGEDGEPVGMIALDLEVNIEGKVFLFSS